MTNNNFGLWLSGCLESRGWNQSELARQTERRGAGISQSQISRVLGGEQAPTLSFCRSMSKALQVPLETVLEQAGLLQQVGDMPPQMKSWPDRLKGFTGPERLAILTAMDAVLSASEAARQARSVSP